MYSREGGRGREEGGLPGAVVELWVESRPWVNQANCVLWWMCPASWGQSSPCTATVHYRAIDRATTCIAIWLDWYTCTWLDWYTCTWLDWYTCTWLDWYTAARSTTRDIHVILWVSKNVDNEKVSLKCKVRQLVLWSPNYPHSDAVL